VWIVVLLALGVGAFYGYTYLFKEKEEKVTYQDVQIVKGDIHITILSTGVVEPENRLEIKPPIAGRIEKVLVDEGDKVRKGQTMAWMSSNERATLIDAASAKGSAVVKEWEELFRPTPVLAPISGSIIKRNVESGQTFGTGEAVFVMSDRLAVKAQVDETDLSQVSLKQRATIILDAYPDSPLPGRVDKIAFEGTTVNNVTVYIVDIIPDQTPEFMRSGMTANVTFDVDTRKNVLVVPANAVKVRDGKSFVLLPALAKEEDAEPIEHEIVVGISDGKQMELNSGLKENDVILMPDFKLKDAASAGSPFSPFPRATPKKKPSS
jgi:macrolide-specific efflux system membrane fusion protein